MANSTFAVYRRPTKTNATAVGGKNRVRWSHIFRQAFFGLIDPMEVLLAEETVATANQRHLLKIGNRRWDDRQRWVTTRIRTDQMAAVELLQMRHLIATGKEISKAEVLAALMASGLQTVIAHVDFGGTTA